MSKRSDEFQNSHKQLYEVNSYPIEVVKELERNAYIAGEKEMIERATAWLEANVWEYTGFDHTELSDAFRQAMEEQQ